MHSKDLACWVMALHRTGHREFRIEHFAFVLWYTQYVSDARTTAISEGIGRSHDRTLETSRGEKHSAHNNLDLRSFRSNGLVTGVIISPLRRVQQAACADDLACLTTTPSTSAGRTRGQESSFRYG